MDPSGVCILMKKAGPFLDEQASAILCFTWPKFGLWCHQTGQSRNQKSALLRHAAICRRARKATVFANFGDSWLASSSCTQAAAEDAGCLKFAICVICECVRLWGANCQVLIDVVWFYLIVFICHMYSFPCLFFVLGLEKQHHPPVLLQMFCLFSGTSSVKGQILEL